MELVFRLRTERPDKKGRLPLAADLHWAGNRAKLSPRISLLPQHWQPAKTKRIHTAADDAAGLNLRLTRFQNTIQQVFQDAATARRDESTVTLAEVQAALAADGLRKPTAEIAAAASDEHAPLPLTTEWETFNERWQRENRHLMAPATLRKYNQVVSALQRFDPALRLAGLTRERLADYVVWLHGQAYRDSTVQQHYKFLRECHRLADKSIPRWLKVPEARYGRPVALKRAEVQALLAADFGAAVDLALERDTFLLQILLLLRDADLRALRRHHVSDHHLPGLGETPCVSLYQEKTGEPVYIPLCEPARVIWARYGGPPPMPVQQERNRRLKEVGKAAGLSREVVLHSFSGKTHHEELAPVWKATTTHTARHTGAAMILLGSEGDQTLKEIALGHVTGSAYGYDTLERYGPLLLQAWVEALG